MTAYEYRVIPAPKRGVKAKGAKTAEDRFAVALAEVMNAQGLRAGTMSAPTCSPARNVRA